MLVADATDRPSPLPTGICASAEAAAPATAATSAFLVDTVTGRQLAPALTITGLSGNTLPQQLLFAAASRRASSRPR